MPPLGIKERNQQEPTSSRKRLTRVPTRDPLLVSREEAVNSLSMALVQAWRACVSVEETLDPANRYKGTISSVVRALNVQLETQERLAIPLENQNADQYDDSRLFTYIGEILRRNNQLLEPSEDGMELVYPKIVRYALDTTDRIVDLLRAIGYKATNSKEWYLQTDQHYALLFMTRVWGANLKFNSQYLFSYFEGLEPPPRPTTLVGEPGKLCSGRPWQALRRRCMGSSLKAMETRNTLLQGFKKSLLPLEEEDWLATLEDTRASLTSEAPDMTEEVYWEMIRTGDELARMMPEKRVKANYKLSTSASTSRQRSLGGFAGYYLDREIGYNPVTMKLNEETGKVVRVGALGTVYRISPPVLVGDYREKGNWQMKLAYSRCPNTYQDMYSSYIGLARNDRGPAVVKMRVIPEPFKFRVISIGSFEDYAVLKPYQQMLWKTLQRFECFSLTGSGADHLVEKVDDIVKKYWDVGMKFLSGDYKGATNYLSSYASKVLLGQWMKTEPEFLMMMQNSLFSATLNFEDAGLGVEGLIPGRGVATTLEPGEMRNGQLMGHPCSFPVLCAVNAAICRMVLEKAWGRRFTLSDLPLLINGDDCLLIGPDRLLPLWRERTKEVGLIESVGKSYFTDKFAMINSRYLKVEAEPSDAIIQERYSGYVAKDVGYLNMGIFAGRKKGSNVDVEVGIGEEVSEESSYLLWQSFAANFTQLNLRCQGLRIGLWDYVKQYEKFFRGPIGMLPVGLPTKQGGLGFSVEDILREGAEAVPSFIDDDLLGDAFLYPKNFSTTKRSAGVMLGEAYFCGGMASAYDDGDWYGFTEMAREASKYYYANLRWSWQMPTCLPDPTENEWVVTVVK